MFRIFSTIILLVCILSGTLHAGEEQVAPGEYAQAGCSISAACGMDGHPCHDESGGFQDEHCCETHTHLHAITGQLHELSHPLHTKQFTAHIPHFFPSSHLQERFIPPRHTA